jgi:hypothetical protein
LAVFAQKQNVHFKRKSAMHILNLRIFYSFYAFENAAERMYSFQAYVCNQLAMFTLV